MYTNVCTADTSSFSHDNFVCQYYARNAPPKIMKTKHFDKGLVLQAHLVLEDVQALSLVPLRKHRT